MTDDAAGVDSGLMIAHYTQAAIVSEMKRQATPASVDSIPSSAMQEDHASMGWTAARKLRTSVDNLARVLGIEYYAAARATDLREHRPAPVPAALIAELRTAEPVADVPALRRSVPVFDFDVRPSASGPVQIDPGIGAPKAST